MRELISLILHEKYKKIYGGLQCLPNICPMSVQCLPNVCPMSAQCLPNVCPMSAQCLLNVCPMSAQCPICLSNVPNFCPMSFAVKSRISSDMFFLETPVFMFLLLRIFDRTFDVIIDNPYLT
jgi:hypothetical protein